ncbi:MAG: hypothetical protein IKK39_02705, partial [Thermoguttaceae bacterium]|nr:hypothetical protein [Thermoguttaceae bacterium]
KITLSGSELRVSKALTIDASGQNITIDAAYKSRVFYISGGTQGAEVNLKGLTITGGKSETFGGGVYTRGATNFTDCEIAGNLAYDGGGVYAYMGIATFTNVTIWGNTAYDDGGALYAHSVNTTITGGDIFRNEALRNGGGLFLRGMTTLTGDAEISYNEATYGGGVYVYSGSTKFDAVTISDNHATVDANGDGGHGGGVYLDVDAKFETGAKISGNTANSGGGVYVYNGATLENATISGNTANFGGGVYVDNGTTTIEESVELSDNKANFGGGVYLESGEYLRGATLANSTIKGANTANISGGGVYAESDALLVNCVVSGATATYGGGVYAESNALLANCTVAGNAATYDGGGVYSLDAILVNTIVAKNFGADFYGALASDSVNNLIGFDPKFVSEIYFDDEGNLVDKDGNRVTADSLDLRLTNKSWAIDRGYNDYVFGSTDLNGESRVVRSWETDATVDIGAYEYQDLVYSDPDNLVPKTWDDWEGPSLTVTTHEDVVDDMDGEISLREALLYAERHNLSGEITFVLNPSNRTIKLEEGQLYVWRGIGIDATDANGDPLNITIDAAQKSRVLHLSPNGGDIALTNLTLTNGKTTGDGGGVLVYSGSAMLENVTISDSDATNGGGVYL